MELDIEPVGIGWEDLFSPSSMASAPASRKAWIALQFLIFSGFQGWEDACVFPVQEDPARHNPYVEEVDR